jgi:hypothetical protein
MADDRETSNNVGDDAKSDNYDTDYVNDLIDPNDVGTTTIINDGATSTVEDDFDDEPLEDVTVKLYVNVDPNGPIIPPDLANAGIIDIYGNPITQTSTTWSDSVDGYPGAISQGIYDELSTNATDISGKGWLGKFIKQKISFK